MARYLGIGIASLMTGLAPEVIVIIGEVTGAWDRVGPIVSDVVVSGRLPTPPRASSPPTARRSRVCAAP